MESNLEQLLNVVLMQIALRSGSNIKVAQNEEGKVLSGPGQNILLHWEVERFL